ncbi:MAG: exodeoxyribonuclease VII large subunit [Deltaproteobacteria bacterium]|nr:exodeoxyribonuclease VII large subunit [Deltaproteobacteria bacterium]
MESEVSTQANGQLVLPLEAAPEKDWKATVPTVGELTRRLRGHIENAFFDVWVRGEISNFRKPVSGHAYFIVKDAAASMRAVLFRGALSKIKFQPKDGMEVLLHGTVTVYEARGEYQLVCDTVEPVGVGALQLAFEQLKQKLHKEGLFDPKNKKPLPFLPRHIGIITSSTGAAVRDILKVFARRFPNLDLMLIPASVQGEKAAPEIVRALEQAQTWNQQLPSRALELLIVGRGGGSLEDLWPFNEEAVARAIHACTIPIISAVGHEIDFTIADFVADVRAPTPSAAAEMAVPRKEELLFVVRSHVNRANVSMHKRLQQLRLHVSHLGQRLVDPRERIKKLRENFNVALEKLTSQMKLSCLIAKKRIESIAQLLNSLSPLRVIARGYSITQDERQRIVRTIHDVLPGSRLVTQVKDGQIHSIVTTPK